MASKSTNNALEGFLCFNDPETPQKMKEVARDELGETEELKEKCLQQMKELIREHKVTCIMRDDFLLRFLRTKKFNVQRAFEALQNYSHQRAEFHSRLMKLRPEVLVTCLGRKMCGFLPYRDADERLLFFYTAGGWNMSICTDEEVTMAIAVLTNYTAENESSQVTGFRGIIDCTSVPLTILPCLLRHAYFGKRLLFNSLPIRYSGFHFINENVIIKYILRALDPFLPKKIKGRIVFHGKSRDALFQHFPRCLVPDDYGGTLGPLNNDHLIELMLEYLQKMKDEQRHFLPQHQ